MIIPKIKQDAIRKSQGSAENVDSRVVAIGQVRKAWSDRMTCDVTLLEGLQLPNVPVLTTGGVINEDRVFGKVELPVEKNYVLVIFVGGRPLILGTFLPFLNNLFLESRQKLPVPDGVTKEYTVKLLEKDKPLAYKRVFPNGTTVEVAENGSVYVELPDLSHLVLHIDDDDTDDSYVEVASRENNNSKKERIRLQTTTDGILIEDQHNDNFIRLNDDGILLDDKNGNTISMETSSVKINGNNLEILQSSTPT